METGTATYPFGFDFQLRILALAFREPRFFLEYGFLIEAQYFDNEEFRHLARILRDHFGKFNRIPEVTLCRDLVRSYATTRRFDEDQCIVIERVLEKIISVELSDFEWLKEEAVKFVQGQMMKTYIIEAAKGLQSGKLEDYSQIVAKFQSILEIAAPNSGVLKFSDVALEIPAQMRENSVFANTRRVKTNIPAFDDHTFGGCAAGKLGVVMARSGGGKSHTLVHLGAAAIRNGFPVFHYTFGDMNQWEVLVRYAANFTGIDSNDIAHGRGGDYFTRMMEWLQGGSKELFVSCHPTDSVTPGMLKSMISSMIARTGVHPGLIVVDYADNLATGHRFSADAAENNSILGHVYQQLLKIAGQFEAVVWTGSQVSRNHWRDASTADSGGRLGVIDSDAAAQAIKKVDQADYILSLNQTRDENEQGIARIYEAKIRFGRDKHTIICNFNKGTSTFTELMVESTPEAEVSDRRRQRREAPAPLEALEAESIVSSEQRRHIEAWASTPFGSRQ